MTEAMGDFSQLHDDDAELLSGGVVNPSKTYCGGSGGNTNYGLSNGKERNKPLLRCPNPSVFYGGTNYGKAKKNR
jgi:hypothetical protein